MLFCLGMAVLVAVLCAATGCNKQHSKIAKNKPHKYEKNGASFEYPKRWKVSDRSHGPGYRNLSIESPYNEIVLIRIMPADSAGSLLEFAREFSRAAERSATGGRIHSSNLDDNTQTYPGQPLLAERFVISRGGVDVPHTRVYRKRVFGDSACFFIHQTPSDLPEDFADGFQMIYSTFEYTGP